MLFYEVFDYLAFPAIPFLSYCIIKNWFSVRMCPTKHRDKFAVIFPVLVFVSWMVYFYARSVAR